MADAGKSSSWYLDPVVAEQRRRTHQDLVHRWARDLEVRRFLKTDLFEEANGADQILFDLYSAEIQAFGMDLIEDTVRRARVRSPNPSSRFLVCDIRRLALKPGCLDLIVSTSTLDHLESAEEFHACLHELAGLLRPGGLLVVTLDNIENPLYRPLRWASRRGWVPFALGYTAPMREVTSVLTELGFEVTHTELLLHNPRMVTTLLCLALRRLLGRRADGPVRALLGLFSQFNRLPSRRWTACFIAACARRPLCPPSSQPVPPAGCAG